MDECDLAAQFQQMDLERALKRALMAARSADEPFYVGGVRCCLDCGEPIPPERIRANPQASRCVACQAGRERR